MKRLYLVRHAHREKLELNDNGISEKGKKQAEAIKAFFKDAKFEKRVSRVHLFSSPKQRCKETLLPTANKFGLSIQTEPLLDEENPSESSRSLQNRISQFLLHCDSSKFSEDSIIVACSHGDWLPIAIQLLGGGSISMEKGAVVGFIKRDETDDWHIDIVLQRPADLFS